MATLEVTSNENGDEQQEWIQEVETGFLVARVYKPYRASFFAAAPALLAACEGMLQHIDDVGDDHDLIQRRAAIVAAIALAKGC